jgi:arylsulfate sulfotransferase
VSVSSVRLFLSLMTVGALVFPALTGAQAPPSVTLTASHPSGQPVGSPILWTAVVSNGGTALPLYQFSVQDTAGTWKVIRDFSLLNVFPWTTLDEGAYTIAVRVYDKTLATTYGTTMAFQFSSRIVANTPAVSPTTHPLVALYSAPPCSGGVQVYFQAPGKSGLLNTPVKSCQPGKSVNFYIVGLYPNTTYQMQQVAGTPANLTHGPVLSFTTGVPAIQLPAVTTVMPPGPNASTADAVQLFSSYASTFPQIPAVATDLNGQPLWYLPIDPLVGAPVIQRPVAGGTLMLLASTKTQSNAVLPGQFLREVDLVNNLVRETSVWAINLQLAALGKSHGINWFSHEGLRLSNGHTLLFGSEERILNNVQGPGPVDVVGDMIIDLDSSYTVKWTWSAFDHLDTSRKAILNETCTTNHGCGPLYLADQANDWTHSNSIAYIPTDGSLVVSVRHQDWVIKIDYQNGSGPGTVLWRLGAGGNFTLNSPSSNSWFSHQHNAELAGTNLVLFDNGNTRIVKNPSGDINSRGQVWALDEARLVATPILNADLADFYPAAGSARRLQNGNYSFGGANIFRKASPRGDAYELAPDGSTVDAFSFPAYIYRVFRMPDLYSYKP